MTATDKDHCGVRSAECGRAENRSRRRVPRLLLFRNPHAAFRDPERGSTLILVMIVIGVLSTIAATLLFSASARYHSTYQSASWQEALIASEAGVDIAMNELRRHVVHGASGDQAFAAGWAQANSSGVPYPDQGRAYPAANPQLPFLLRPVHGGEGAAMLGTRVYVDVPGKDAPPTPNNSFKQDTPPTIDPFINEQRDGRPADNAARWWYRIRALGYAGVSGPARSNLDTRDNRLRKFSFVTDWRTNQAVNQNSTGPYVSRLIEVVAKPLTNFRNALMADVQINLGNQDVLIDSYDSSKGLYGASITDAQGRTSTNTGTMGNLATNGTLINASHAVVKGDAMTNNGSVDAGENVIGQQRSDYYQELLHVDALTGWETAGSGLLPSPGAVQSITTDADLPGSTDRANPAKYRVNSINLKDDKAGSHTLFLTRPSPDPNPQAPVYVKLYVQDSITTSGLSCIEVDNNVYAIIYVQGNVQLNGTGIVNDDELASRLLINGLKPTDISVGTPRMDINTDQDFEGMIYAPDHDLSLNMTASTSGKGKGGKKPKVDDGDRQQDHTNGYNGIYGTFVGKTITVLAKTHVHYDEVLREAGPVNHYEIVNWFEDQASRATVNW